MALAIEMFKKSVLGALCIVGLMLASVSQADEAIAERIKPVGEVCVQGDPCASASVETASAGAAGKSGDAVYNAACAACHGSGILGAPKKDDSDEWKAREAKAGDFAALLASAIKGVNSMPAKGGCSACSDDELASAIEYMSGLSR
ncbi:c-type cytochrome [Aestuariirhabdus sp. Z084]|uniref:c-type cytochrome n=1 Tax=Aestuariirhabdus haliotis TaxID=2918751 RepID=UPI00201B3825|nr:c-type cytochrome [Aestuariirhabdus haliotis]MCL6416566.1 c-type cytochrome [Aestuariirhabdus haliotis]MCL6420567.1 c-type cytochrome [Aestuariirhabdus haliotis]